jgi:hypothetical protein
MIGAELCNKSSRARLELSVILFAPPVPQHLGCVELATVVIEAVGELMANDRA